MPEPHVGAPEALLPVVLRIRLAVADCLLLRVCLCFLALEMRRVEISLELFLLVLVFPKYLRLQL